ncbi:alpha/beta hydrolase [Mycobacterium sp. BMJ-28]
MSIEIPGWLRWVGDLIGEDFPDGDEDKVWAQARRWKDFADQLEAQKSAIEAASRTTLSGFAQGQAHTAMSTEFQTLTSGDASLDVLVQQLRELSDAVDKTGTEIEFAKEMYIANLAILAATLIALAASAWINWGAPVEGAAAIAATEFTISQIIRAAIAKVVEAGASKIITELALRALQGAAINAIVSGGLNAGVQGLQMLQGHRHEFDGASLGNDIKGGLLAGAIAGPLLHGARFVDAGSPLGNQFKTFGASFAANTTGSIASQYALTGHVNFGDATMSGLLFGGIDGAHPNAARVPHLSAESGLGALGSDRASFGSDEHGTAPQGSRSPDPTMADATNSNTRSAGVTEVDRPLNIGSPEAHSPAVAEPNTAAHTAAGSSATTTAGPAVRAPEAPPTAPPARQDAPVTSTPNSSATPSPSATPKSGLAAAPAGHAGAPVEPAARVADSPAPRAAAATDGAPRREALTPDEPRSTPHTSAEAPTPVEPDSSHSTGTPERTEHSAPEAQHPGDRWQDAARHTDESHARALADDALSRRIPPVEPEALRTPQGFRDQALARAHDNADWWHGLTGDEQRALIDSYPRDIGNAEGIPAAARHEANTHSIAHDRDQLRSRQESGERLTRAEQKYLNRLDKIDDALQEARRTAEDAGVGGPYVMAFDPRAFGGDGRAVVAFGDDPYRADSVSWHVPGLTTTVDSLGTNMTNALNHLQSTHLERPGISASSIAWIGYDAPSGLGSWRVAFHGLAHEGGDILHSDIAGFNAARDALAGDGSHFNNNHVFGHSYGSTTTSYAGEGGRLHDQVTTVTLLGSPGAGPHHTAEGFGIGDNVYVASSSRDWVTTLGGRDSGGRFLGRFGLGRDPAMDTWGGHRITSEFPADMDTAGTVGTHTAYYHYVEGPSGTHPGVRSESLANFGRIAAGHPERLDAEQHRRDTGRSGWLPGLRTEEPAVGRPLRLDDDTSGHEHSVERKPFDPRWHRGEAGSADQSSDRPQRPLDDGAGAADHHVPRDSSSSWEGPAGEQAAHLLPTDDSGYRITPRDCEFLGITPEQVQAWAAREAPLGMTPAEFKEFSSSLGHALTRDGFGPQEVDIRLQGSSARFFSGEHKELPAYSDLHGDAEAQARMSDWFGSDTNHPLRRPFDSMYRLKLDSEPSDYDIQISSDAMVEACKQRWEALGAPDDLVHPKYGFVTKDIFKQMFPALWQWADEWITSTGRPVVPALFPGSGPPDTSTTGVSSHFRDTDWRIHPERTEPR